MKKILQLVLLLLLPISVWAQIDSAVIVPDTVPDMSEPSLYSRKKSTVLSIDTLVQETVNVADSVTPKKKRLHSPKIASCLSIIPGGGQIYNRKWWKLPIVYGTMGVATYFVCDYGKKYVVMKKEYFNRVNGNTELLLPEYARESDDLIKGIRDEYRSRMEISIAALSILYMLNIIDACVDAHLFYFDVSDDLSLQWQPQIQVMPHSAFTPSVGITFNLK